MRKLGFYVLGMLGGTLAAWAGLLGWAALTLNHGDSLWDRNPSAADAFFALWFILAVAGAVIAERLSRRNLSQ